MSYVKYILLLMYMYYSKHYPMWMNYTNWCSLIFYQPSLNIVASIPNFADLQFCRNTSIQYILIISYYCTLISGKD